MHRRRKAKRMHACNNAVFTRLRDSTHRERTNEVLGADGLSEKLTIVSSTNSVMTVQLMRLIILNL